MGKREKVIDGAPEPIEVRNVMEEFPDDAWEHTFPRDTERKKLWCDVACLRVYQVRDELKWKNKAPMLTDVREIQEVILPGRVITKKDIRGIIKKKHKVREKVLWFAILI